MSDNISIPLVIGVAEKFDLTVRKLIEKNMSISCMESCTSGLVSSLLSDTEGASAIFRGGITAYSNDIKILFGVSSDVISKYGVYSHECASQMSDVCRRTFNTDIGIGVTGCLSRSDPNNPEGNPGVVYFCININGCRHDYMIDGITGKSRNECKHAVCKHIADKLLNLI